MRTKKDILVQMRGSIDLCTNGARKEITPGGATVVSAKAQQLILEVLIDIRDEFHRFNEAAEPPSSETAEVR